MKQLLNLKEYAEFLGIPYTTFLRYRKNNPENFAKPKMMGTKGLYWIEDIKRKLAEQ